MALEKGAATAQAVLDFWDSNPGSHNQADWVRSESCGTTRCAAGTALHLHGVSDKEIQDLAGTINFGVLKAAAPLLGLGFHDAQQLFYKCGNASAREAMQWIALGKELDWETIHASNPVIIF